MAEVDDAVKGPSSEVQGSINNDTLHKAPDTSEPVDRLSKPEMPVSEPSQKENPESAESVGLGVKALCTENTNQNNNEVQYESSREAVDRQRSGKADDVGTARTQQQIPNEAVSETNGSTEQGEENDICEEQRNDGNQTGSDAGFDSCVNETAAPESETTNNDGCETMAGSESRVDERTCPGDDSGAPQNNNNFSEEGSIPAVFSERISSDGGSVEIAEEADEEDTIAQGGAISSNLADKATHSHLDDTASEKNSQHSIANSPAVVMATEDATEHQKSIPTESVPTDDAVHIGKPMSMANSDVTLSSKRDQNLPSASIHVEDDRCRTVTKMADDKDDDLLSELAAELDAENDSQAQEQSRTEEEELEVSSRDDQTKLIQLVDQWKKKYCHAQAELQSLQVTMQAQSHQRLDWTQEREKMEAEMKKGAEAIQRVHLVRIKELEKDLEQKKKEIVVAKERQESHDLAAKKAISKLQTEMVQRIDQVKNMYEEVVKEKETMVIRYAKSEKENLDLKKAKEGIEKRRREAGQGLEVISSHNKQLKAERAKLMSDLDAKDLEITALKKDIEQMKDDVSSVGIKVKWAQNKLKNELESHKDTKAKLAKTEQRLVEAKEETEQIRKNTQEMIRTYQESEEIRSNSLDLQLKEKEEELKLHHQEKEDQMEMHNTRLRELEALKKAHHDSVAELDSLKVKSKCLEDERLHTEGLLTQFKGLLNSQKEENRKLVKQMEELKSLKRQLEESKENVQLLEQSIASRKEDEKDLETELDRSRQKEAELLQFTEKMTAKNTTLHSENLTLGSKVDKLTEECRNLKAELDGAKSEISQLTLDLNKEKQYREREAALLSAKLGERSKALDQLQVQLDDAKDETKTLKRKHAANLKDLTRQLQHAKKKIESMEGDGANHGGTKDTFSSESRTSSTGSLDTLGNSALNGGGSNNVSSGSSGGGSIGRHDDSPQAGQDHTVAIAGGNDFPGIDKAMLVDRIVRLQKQLQKKGEKIEFLQEHISQLVEELQKKSKIIQQYIMREEVGALAPAASDANKAQMSKQSGIMASLYRSHSADPNMTLDLSLEINRKLQAVLEDTLLKNITLKENIDTLGQEIARLSEEAQLSSRRMHPSRKK